MKDYSALRRLGVANTGIELGVFFNRLIGYVLPPIMSLSLLRTHPLQELEYLDVSNNRMDKNFQDTITTYIESTHTLKVYVVSITHPSRASDN